MGSGESGGRGVMFLIKFSAIRTLLISLTFFLEDSQTLLCLLAAKDEVTLRLYDRCLGKRPFEPYYIKTLRNEGGGKTAEGTDW